MIKVFAIFSSSRETPIPGTENEFGTSFAFYLRMHKTHSTICSRLSASVLGAIAASVATDTPHHADPLRGKVILVVKYCIRAMNYKLNFNRIEPILRWRELNPAARAPIHNKPSVYVYVSS